MRAALEVEGVVAKLLCNELHECILVACAEVTESLAGQVQHASCRVYMESTTIMMQGGIYG